MKPKIKTRLANLIAKLAGSDDYDPNVKPITPLEFYLDEYISEPIPVIHMPGNSFLTGTKVTIENADLLATRILAHQQVILTYSPDNFSPQFCLFICKTATGRTVDVVKLSYYLPQMGDNAEVKITGEIRYYRTRHSLDITVHSS